MDKKGQNKASQINTSFRKGQVYQEITERIMSFNSL